MKGVHQWITSDEMASGFLYVDIIFCSGCCQNILIVHSMTNIFEDPNQKTPPCTLPLDIDIQQSNVPCIDNGNFRIYFKIIPSLRVAIDIFHIMNNYSHADKVGICRDRL